MAIDRKACFQRQLLDISNETDDLDERVTALEQGGITVDAYTKAESDAKFVSKTNLTDYSINDIIVADSEIQSGAVDLRAVSAQDVKSEVSLDPSSAIIKTTSGTNNSTIGVSGTDVDISTGTLKYNSNEVLSADSDGNLNKNLIRTSQITSFSGEDSDSKGEITLSSGLRHGSAYIYADGEESGASIYLRGTTSVGSEGVIEISGETTFNTANRINVYDGSDTEQIAYLSDISGGGGNTLYRHKIKIIKKDGSDNIIGFIAFAILNTSATQFTTLISIAGQMVYEPASGYWKDGSNYRDVIALEGQMDATRMQIRLNYPEQPDSWSLLQLQSSESGVTVSDTLVTL